MNVLDPPAPVRLRDRNFRRFELQLAAVLLTTICVGAGATNVPSPKTVVYLGGTLIDVSVGIERENTAIIIQGDRVVAVRSADGFQAKEGDDIVDIKGKFVIPGLVNSHVHLATLADPAIAKAYLRRELYSGVTTVRDMAGDARLLSELKREAEFDEIPAPDIFYVALMAGPAFFVDPRTHDAARGRVAGQVPWMQAVTSQTNLAVAIAAARGTGATAVKLYGDLSASLLKSIVVEAHRQHLRVWAHAAVFPARPSDVVDAGVDVISHACLLGYQLSNPPILTSEDSTPVDVAKATKPSQEMDALFDRIKRHDTILDATLYAYEIGGFKSCSGEVSEFLARQAHRAGVLISSGTDDDPNWDDPDSALDVELSLLVDKAGLTPVEALRAATQIGARAAGQEKDVGTIEAGKLANLVVLNKDPLDKIANIRSVLIVVKHGVRYARSDYRPTTADELKIPKK
jgi:imidazolonepropionase-like amidohydrolase